jgi:hypothetical protein
VTHHSAAATVTASQAGVNSCSRGRRTTMVMLAEHYDFIIGGDPTATRSTLRFLTP